MATAKRPTIKQLDAFLRGQEASIARAFRQAVAQIKSQARIAELEAAIRANDLEAAMRAAGLRPGSWTVVSEAVRASYISGGVFAVTTAIPKRYGFQFDPINPRAIDWLLAESSRLVTDITTHQREAVQVIMSAGVAEGRGPRSVALDIVGRVGRTGRRQGGVIGLHGQFAGFADDARRQLEDLDPSYLARTRRDRRYDRLVQAAIDNGTPLPQSAIDTIIGRYEDRLLQTRGETIARTEAIRAMNASAEESLRQVIDDGLADPDAVEREWDATLDSRTRPSHAAASGQRRRVGEPFDIGGYPALYPGDPALPAGESINCRCFLRPSVDFSRTLL